MNAYIHARIDMYSQMNRQTYRRNYTRLHPYLFAVPICRHIRNRRCTGRTDPLASHACTMHWLDLSNKSLHDTNKWVHHLGSGQLGLFPRCNVSLYLYDVYLHTPYIQLHARQTTLFIVSHIYIHEFNCTSHSWSIHYIPSIPPTYLHFVRLNSHVSPAFDSPCCPRTGRSRPAAAGGGSAKTPRRSSQDGDSPALKIHGPSDSKKL